MCQSLSQNFNALNQIRHLFVFVWEALQITKIWKYVPGVAMDAWKYVPEVAMDTWKYVPEVAMDTWKYVPVVAMDPESTSGRILRSFGPRVTFDFQQ